MIRSASQVEILVHISAPSKTSDDAAHRQLAEAYLAFQPERRIDLPPPLPREDAASSPPPQSLGKVSDEIPSQPPASLAPAPSSSLGMFSQTLSFESAVDNLSSPALSKLRACHGKEASHPKTPGQHPMDSKAPNGEIADSYPMPSTLHVSPTRVLSRFLRSSNPSTAPGTLKKIPSPELNFRSPSSKGSARTSSQQTRSSPLSKHPAAKRSIGSTIPTTPVTNTDRPQKRAIDGPATILVTDSIEILSSDSSLDAYNSFRARSEPPPKRLKELERAESVALQRSSSDSGPIRDPKAIHFTPPDLDSRLEILPPSPPASVDDLDPGDLVTEKLAKLSQDLSSRYRPNSEAKPEPFDRGYWLVDCSSWDDETRANAWSFLANYIRVGLAGWGVWLRRDEPCRWLRLYCWGYVVKHTYLLLYLASGRQMKVTEGKWIGADGEVLLEVSPVTRS